MGYDDWGSGQGCQPRPPQETLTLGTWSFVCFAGDGTGNVTITSDATSDTFSQAIQSWAESTISIGSNPIGGSSTVAALRGAIQEVSLWSVPLTAGQKAALYNGGSGCKVR